MALNLLAVVDDCLREIFNNLTVPELAAIASTCTRFRTIAREVFASLHKSKRLKISVIDIREYGYHDEGRVAAAILRHFGDLLTNVEVYFVNRVSNVISYNTRVFQLMTKYCTGKLEMLNLLCSMIFNRTKSSTPHRCSAM